jgi:hypothetical protein
MYVPAIITPRPSESGEAEGDGVVEERLPDEEREAEHGPLRIAREHGPPDLGERGRLPLPDGDGLRDLVQCGSGLALNFVLNGLDDLLASPVVAVDVEPAWTLRHVAAHQQDHHGQDRAERLVVLPVPLPHRFRHRRRVRVMRKSFFRPNRSVRRPRNSAPRQAPAT